MTELPITFPERDIKAILSKEKSAHRIPIKTNFESVSPGYYLDAYCGETVSPDNPRGMGRDWHLWTEDNRLGPLFAEAPCAPGDHLYVKETFALVGDLDLPSVLYRANGYEEECRRHGFDERSILQEREVQWRSGVQMPRHLSRITLIITDVKLHRLNDMYEEDAMAEGAKGLPQFSEDWDAKRSRKAAHLWERNPWVVALSFRSVLKNINRR